jgi:hypothetical protein
MSEGWISKPLGPGLWWFVPKHDEAVQAASEAPGWEHEPVRLAWVGHTKGGLFYEHMGGGGRQRRISEDEGYWHKADLTPPKAPE